MLSTPIFNTGIVSLLESLVVYGLYKVLVFIYRELTSPLRDLLGPPSPSFIFGNFKQLYGKDTGLLQEEWIRKYGDNFRFSSLFGKSALFTTDLKALNYILVNNYDFQKPQNSKYNLQRATGNGMLVVEGDEHANQRRILNPAFGLQQIRDLTEIFVEEATQLRDIWSAKVTKHGGIARVDGLSWLNRAALDVIGIAGFNYNFNALAVDDFHNPFKPIVSIAIQNDLLTLLKGVFPIFRYLPFTSDPRNIPAVIEATAIVNKLVSDSKAIVATDKHDSSSKTWSRRDLLSLIIRANTMPDLPANKRMNDADVVAQVFTFLLAGHETTSASTTWALYALTQNKEIQRKLREELNIIATDNPTMEDLNSLPYLDRVVRETLRVHPTRPLALRTCVRDNVIPLSKPFIDSKGVVRNEIRIRKGQSVLIPITVVNRSKELWGEDAMEFKPERWEKVPEAVTAIPGIWSNILSFMSGPRGCIGYRFALAEMKALLFTLVRAFELDLAVPGKDIGKTPGIVQHPVILTNPSKESAIQLPLVIRPVSSEL